MDQDIIFKRTAAFISDLHNLESSLSGSTGKGTLTPLQQNLLRILYFSNPKTLSSLSECMNMNMPNTSREVKKLAQQELIVKSQSPDDKRIIELSLAEKGNKIVEFWLEKMKTAFFQNSGSWDDARSRCFLDSLSVLEKELFGR
jgi:DNA-binding MarR family transcriptional regulator